MPQSTSMILGLGDSPSRSIVLQTRRGTNVENFQGHEISAFVRNQFPDLRKRYGELAFRTNPSAVYNCHGMALAARRTCIEDSSQVELILKEDSYVHIKDIKASLPGDILVYYSESGEIEHSALVIATPEPPLYVPIVVSKWGAYSEAIHAANRSPYNYAKARAYRIVE